MKAVMINKPRVVSLHDIEEPQILNPDDVKIKIAYAGICIDDMPFFNKNTTMSAWPILSNIGHEMSGTVVEMGSSAKRYDLKEGDLVSGYAWNYCGRCHYCRMGLENHCKNPKTSHGTIAEYIVWNAKQLCRLPKSVSLEEGCLTDPLGYCLYGFNKLSIRQPSRVMVIGATTMGLILLQLAKRSGAIDLTMVESIPSKQEIALKLGADHIIDPSTQNANCSAFGIAKWGYDTIFEASGDEKMLVFASKVLARQGTLAYTTIYGPNNHALVNADELYLKEATLRPFYLPPNNLSLVMDIMPQINLKAIITKIFDLEHTYEAFELFETGIPSKILVKL